MDQPFVIDGYAVADLIGFGATGEVWRGRDERTGDPVALKRLWEPLPVERIDRVHREAVLIRELADGHAVVLREIQELPEGEVVLVMEYAAGGSLASLITRRGRLHPSEIVTVLGPLAQVLAAAHERGLRHGDITPNNVVFTADGRPMLSDFGIVLITGDQAPADNGFRDPALRVGEMPGTASDVFGLAAMGFAALTGVPPRPADATDPAPAVAELAPWVPAALASAVEAAIDPDPSRRPDAAAFAAAVLRSCEAAPIRMVGPRRGAATDAEPDNDSARGARRTPRIPRTSGRSRPFALVMVVATVLVIAALAGVGWAHIRPPAASALGAQPPIATPNQTAGVTPEPTRAPTHANDYRAIVAHLFALRAKAFRTDDLSLLRAVYARPSEVLDMDHGSLRTLVSQRFRARGFIQRIDDITTEDFSANSAVLWVKTTIPAYTIVSRRGRVVARRAARVQRFEMDLDRQHGRWLVSGLGSRAAPDPDSVGF